MGTNYFKFAEKKRINLTQVEKKRITLMYKSLAEDIEKEASRISQRTNVSSILRTQYLQGLEKQVNAELKNMSARQKASMEEGMKVVSEAVVVCNKKLINSYGIQLSGAYSYIPRDVITEVSTGRLYKDRWTLSQAIWRNTTKTQIDIRNVISKGIAAQKSTYEIAKDLEKYVNPAKIKDWEWSKVYPGTAKVVDYNAQRLARTMISHAYQDSFVRVTKDNPFIEEYEWISSGGSRMCDICAERDGKHFKKGDLPLDHPNGMCTFGIVTDYNMNDVSNRLAAWVNGNPDSELDDYARAMGYSIPEVKSSIKTK